MILTDISAERAVLAGICRYGVNTYLDIADICSENTFTVEYNRDIFICLKHLFGQNVEHVDIASIFSAANELGIYKRIVESGANQHLTSLFNFPVIEKNVRKLAAKIRKLEITRLLRHQLGETCDKLLEVSGNESITEILGIAEDSIFDFSSLINDSEGPKQISKDLVEYIEYLATNPVDKVGVPTGISHYDKAIGGGLRPGTVNVIGARIKVGKSLISTNIGYYIANEQKLPVLSLDTEMTYEDHLHRLMAMASDSYIYDIETGKFAQKPGTERRVRETARKIQQDKVPYFHESIAGMPFEEQIAIMRRWLVREVGLNPDGTAKPCVIIYDYLKLMTSEGLQAIQEYQALGFLMTSLHNFAVRYKVPILLLTQLNREGITKESTDVASGSDRILWLCSNFSILKVKSEEEIGMDGVENGNRKLVTLVARHGAGMDFGEYINLHFEGNKAKITQGRLKSEIMKEKKAAESDASE